MFSFIIALILLVLGYLFYGKVVERVFGIDTERPTACYTHRDGIDFMPIGARKVFLIQFLNIAGTGPIFGAILGILYGPAAYIWIVLGCIFAGAVHDFMTGIICIRKDGASLPEFIGDELGNGMRQFMRVLSLVLLVLVGTVFVTTPADILDTMVETDGFLWSKHFFVTLIFIYYILATLLPIDKLIGKIYPIFGAALIIMALGLLHGIFWYDGTVPEVTEAFTNHHPTSSMPLFPGLCITIACGAVSGFHGTQSPIMARCTTNEKYCRPIFYGAMITEGIVALIWAAAAIKFADSLDVAGSTPYEKLVTAMTNAATGNTSPGILVHTICSSWMGTIGALLAVLGVVAAPITSGDTAFRSARLIIADFTKFGQGRFLNRIILCLPVFLISFMLMFIDFHVLWRYFAWVNQTLATIALWSFTVWLTKRWKESHKMSLAYLVCFIPAVFMTYVCSSYILIAPEGLQLDATISYAIAAVVTLVLVVLFYRWRGKEYMQ